VATSINRYTNLEKDNGTFAVGVASGIKGIGALASSNSWLGECVALWVLTGVEAQFTDAQAKTFLQSFGWTIPWS
jgi:hypothetical protein